MPLWQWWTRAPSTQPAIDERVHAADAALRELAMQLEASGMDMTSMVSSVGSQMSATSLRGDHLVHTVQAVLAVPAGKERDGLVNEFRRLLDLALLPESQEVLDTHMSLLRDSWDNKELADALAGILAALSRDTRLESHVATAGATAGREDCFEELAIVCQQASSLAGAELRCEEVLQLRRVALQQADALLGRPRRAAAQCVAEAAERRQQLQEEQAAVAGHFRAELVQPLEEEGRGLESEVNILQERAAELRRELNTVALLLDDCRARQRSWMTQVDGWRHDLEEVKSTKAKSQMELSAQAESIQMRRDGCSDFLGALQSVSSGLMEAAPEADATLESLIQQAERDVTAGTLEVQAFADAWLADSMAIAERWRADDARAVQTLELMGVEHAEQELPTRHELPALLAGLRKAWKEREALGEVTCAQRAEVEGLLFQLASLESSGQGGVSSSNAEKLRTKEPRVGTRALEHPMLSGDLELDISLPSPIMSPAGGHSGGSKGPQEAANTCVPSRCGALP